MVECPTCGEPTLVPLLDIFEAAAQPEKAPLQQDDDSHVHESPQEAKSEIASRDVIPSYAQSDFAIEYLGDSEPPDDDADEKLESVDDPSQDENSPSFTLKRKPRTDDDMDLTPMVDVTFQLLIFFMVTASFAMQKSIQVPTPDPDQQGATQQMQTLEDLQGTSILVKIDAANSILVDDEPLGDLSRLADVLRDKMRKEQKTELLLTAHSAALHRGVIAVIDAANEAGMQKIRLASKSRKDD